MSKTELPDPQAVEALARLGTEASAPHVQIVQIEGLGEGLPEKVPLAFDRRTQTFKALRDQIDAYRQLPGRTVGTARADTLESFIELTKRHKTDDSVLFGATQWPDPKLTAVIDYHTVAHEPRWMQHRIAYAFPLTDEFKAWVSGDGQPMEQLAFAAFIEEHAAELASPYDGERNEFEPLFKEKFATPSELIMLSRELEVFIGGKAKRSERLQTGERTVEFTSEHTDAKGERITIPGIFMVSVPAFIDGEPVRIPARLRYRLKGGEIVWFYQLYRWQFWLRDQVQKSLHAAAKATSLPAFEGAPED